MQRQQLLFRGGIVCGFCQGQQPTGRNILSPSQPVSNGHGAKLKMIKHGPNLFLIIIQLMNQMHRIGRDQRPLASL